MTSLRVILLVLFILQGCDSSSSRQFSLRYPALLTLTNTTDSVVEIKSIYSTADADGGFILDGGKIAEGETLTLNLSEASYNIINQKKYVIEGRCGDRKNWIKNGELLETSQLEDWKIAVSISHCNDIN